MSEILNTNENISDIALAYFDEIEEVLKEIKDDSLYFSLSPFTSEYKRLYLIGDMIYTEHIRLTAHVPEGFSVKVLLKDEYTSYRNFEEASDTVYCSMSSRYLNAIPVDFLVRSESINYGTVNLDIKLRVGEREET